MKQPWNVMSVLLLALLFEVRASDELAVTLNHQGHLAFNPVSNATSYRVEWAARAGGAWTSFTAAAHSLDAIDAAQVSGVHTVEVPMFYRVVARVTPPLYATNTIQGEAYSAMSGVQVEGGTVGWFDQGDWLGYDNVDFGAGVQSFTIMAAKMGIGGSVELRLGGTNGTLIGVFNPEDTGGWANYRQQEIAVTNTSGRHDLYLVATGADGVCNIDWFSFSTNPIYVPNYVLFWEDEFEGTTLDTAKWHPVQHGFVDNNELQFYTDRPENISVSNGHLWLTARRETYTGTGPWMNGQYKTSDYTSGKIQGDGKVSFQYGRIEARLKMPRGYGTWPAFWMLGANIHNPGIGWPRCGEIDIMEHPNVLDTITAAVHTEAYNHTIGTSKTMGYPISTYDTQFHVYGVEWTEQKLSFYVDDHTFFTVTKAEMGDTEAEWPFDQPFWLILNLAVGGPYGGDPTDGDYPYTMQVDWVRVYEDQQ